MLSWVYMADEVMTTCTYTDTTHLFGNNWKLKCKEFYVYYGMLSSTCSKVLTNIKHRLTMGSSFNASSLFSIKSLSVDKLLFCFIFFNWSSFSWQTWFFWISSFFFLAISSLNAWNWYETSHGQEKKFQELYNVQISILRESSHNVWNWYETRHA